MHTFYVSIVLGVYIVEIIVYIVLKLQPLHRFLCVICVMIVIFQRKSTLTFQCTNSFLNIGVRLLSIIKDNTVYLSAENKCQDI